MNICPNKTIIYIWSLDISKFQLLKVKVSSFDAADSHLPKTSEDFFSSHSCNRDEVLKSLEIKEDDDSFFRWVLAQPVTRHVTQDGK